MVNNLRKFSNTISSWPKIGHFYTDLGTYFALNKPSRSRFYVISFILDYLTVLVIVGIGLYFASLDPPNIQFSLHDPTIAYEERSYTIMSEFVGLVNVAIPFIILVSTYLWVGRNRDLHHAILGMAQSVALSFATVAFAWWAVGGLRPIFMSRCKPDINLIQESVHGIIYYYNVNEICSGLRGEGLPGIFGTKGIYDAMRGFPSGHGALAMSTWGFLAIYIGAKLKVFDKYAHVWKLTVANSPLFLGLFFALSTVRDYHHTWVQAFAGVAVGLFWATIIGENLA